MSAKSLLRKTEKLVLGRLELDGRYSLSEIGKKIRRSQQQVSYTLSSLLKKEMIRGFYAIIDYSKMDILNFRVHLKLSYYDTKKFEELINYLVSDTHVSHVITCGGRNDLICNFFALNPSQFNKTLREIMAKFPDQIRDYEVLTIVVIRWFGRKYMLKDKMINQIIFGGDRQPEEIDETDMKIISELSDNARESSVKIAEKLGTTPKTVMARIRQLKNRQIIMGFRPLINTTKMGYQTALILVRYHNLSIEMENELIQYLKVHPNVVGITKTLGEWDIEIEVETKDTMEFRKVEIELRQKFAQLIQKIESIPIYKTYKKNFFPAFLLQAMKEKD